MTVEEKREALKTISGMTQKECQSTLLKIMPESAPKLMERERQVSDEVFELRLGLSKELHDQMEVLGQSDQQRSDNRLRLEPGENSKCEIYRRTGTN